MHKRGFTLMELLVVIGIIAVLAAILIPVVTNARKSGYKATCVNNMREIGAALIAYRQDKAIFPDITSQVGLQSVLINEKKLTGRRTCPKDADGTDSYSAMYNYWGYAKATTPTPLKDLASAKAVYSALNNNAQHYWHPNDYPDSDFPGLANPNCPNGTIVTICVNHTDMAGKYVILRKDGTVDFSKPDIKPNIKPDVLDDEFWMLSKAPR
ncbi:MAG: type II secretion system protein [bacterium]